MSSTVRKEVATKRFLLCSLHFDLYTHLRESCLLKGETRGQVLVPKCNMHPNYNPSRHHKRPHHAPHDRNEGSASSSRPIPQSAYVQAYEAQLVYGQRERAEDLYAKGGRGLMRWQGEDGGEIWADR